MSQSLRHSSILAIAAEVKALQKQGRQLLDFTVGDFSSKQFPIPTELENATVDALRAGEGEQAEFVHAVASQLTPTQRAAVRTLAAE